MNERTFKQLSLFMNMNCFSKLFFLFFLLLQSSSQWWHQSDHSIWSSSSRYIHIFRLMISSAFHYMFSSLLLFSSFFINKYLRIQFFVQCWSQVNFAVTDLCVTTFQQQQQQHQHDDPFYFFFCDKNSLEKKIWHEWRKKFA